MLRSHSYSSGQSRLVQNHRRGLWRQVREIAVSAASALGRLHIDIDAAVAQLARAEDFSVRRDSVWRRASFFASRFGFIFALLCLALAPLGYLRLGCRKKRTNSAGCSEQTRVATGFSWRVKSSRPHVNFGPAERSVEAADISNFKNCTNFYSKTFYVEHVRNLTIL